ncbi:MAG: class I SAM-dependent DNA methyltransferase [Methylocystaceae bacterium]|nr:class I SAM-dependent DNA methyltransferase [Methylocystaceae bacterium]
MTPLNFIQKWQKANIKESAAAQSHFNDLCELFDHPKPLDADPEGTWFTFEYGMKKTTGSQGFADVYKKGFFGWEYKGKKKDLTVAYAQLQQYAPALSNPPLLIVSDIERFVIHTNWNDLVSETYEISLEELLNPDKLNILRYCFHDPEKLKPKKSRQQLTEEIAGKFAKVTEQLRARGNNPHEVAHFVNRLIFCMFAEDIELLPKNLFTDILKHGLTDPTYIHTRLSSLFRAMNKGGEWGKDDIVYFNGGLFDNDTALKLNSEEIALVFEAAQKDWSDIDPSIMGTLFERGLDPEKQSQLGAHYTDRDMIMKIINPVVVDPLLAEWEETKSNIQGDLDKAAEYRGKENTSKNAAQITKAANRAQKTYNKFLAKIRSFKVLDPACGSGNFLYLSLSALKDIERLITLYGEATFNHSQHMPEIGPQNVHGIEINPYAAELARVSVWIGEIQWIKKHGFTVPANPVLRKLKNIVNHDALINEDGTEYHWPKVDVIVGNPPFIGDKKMIRELGEEYTASLRKLYKSRVDGGADFVCFWFAKAYEYMKMKKLSYAGLVSTNSIRGGKNRVVLDKIATDLHIYNAWPDEPWVNEGAAVRVAMTSFSADKPDICLVRDEKCQAIYSDLTPAISTFDAAQVKVLPENKEFSFIGTQKNGPFTVSFEQAQEWLKLPLNPNGKPNSDVVRPWANGQDVTRRPSHTWIIDFNAIPLNEAALYEAPFEHVLNYVKPTREGLRRKNHREKWWIYGENRPALRNAISKKKRFIATSMVAKHRFFVWMPKIQIPENLCVVIASDSDAMFGVVSSKHHVLWSLQLCTWLGKGNDQRYTPSTCFDTFPFPDSYLSNEEIAEAAKTLNDLREKWLNPPDLVEVVPTVETGIQYPSKYIGKSQEAEAILKKRTLTNLYNENPMWLQMAHQKLDEAVAKAYGWPSDLSDDEILEKLFALNQERTKG